MNCNVSYVVSVVFDRFNFFCRVVVENAKFCIISADYNPLLTRYEFSASDRGIRNLERAYGSLSVIIINDNSSSVEGDCYPWE